MRKRAVSKVRRVDSTASVSRESYAFFVVTLALAKLVRAYHELGTGKFTGLVRRASRLGEKGRATMSGMPIWGTWIISARDSISEIPKGSNVKRGESGQTSRAATR